LQNPNDNLNPRAKDEQTWEQVSGFKGKIKQESENMLVASRAK
jgi:hypothetical protein